MTEAGRRRAPVLRKERARPHGRGGYTLAQVAIVLVALATGVHLAIPHLRRWRAEAGAEEVRERVERVVAAARAYRDRAGGWPADAEPGERPDGLAEELAELSFRGDRYELDWETFPLPDGLPSARGVQEVGGVVVRSDDPAVLDALRSHAWSSDGWLIGSDRVVRLLVPPE